MVGRPEVLALVQALPRKEKETDLALPARRAGLVGRLLPAVEVLGYVPDTGIRAAHDAALRRAMAIFTVEGAAQVDWRGRIAAAEALGRAGDPRFGEELFEANLRPIPDASGWRLGVYPVTVQEYLTFVEDQGYLCKKGDFHRIPANKVHWAWNRSESDTVVVESHSPPLVGGEIIKGAAGLFDEGETPNLRGPGENQFVAYDQEAVEHKVLPGEWK